MYTSILVPLDGSARSERALPVALGLAKRSDARVELFHAHDFPPAATGAPAFETRFDHEAAARMGVSLDALARRLTLDTGLDVRVVMRSGPADTSVVDYSATSGTDLIVIATHGHGGLGRMWLGSVATDVVRQASVPVLLIRPHPRSHDADLIALAARPRATLSEIVFGSVAQTLIHYASVPVLVYHPRGTAAADPTGAPGAPTIYVGH